METVLDMFPDAMALLARHEAMIARLMDINLQLAKRVANLERQAAALA
jgi:hypothetical protein